jgi:hypothetical protein
VRIPETATKHACWLVEQLREVGAAVDVAPWNETAELDEEASMLHETPSDLLIELLAEANLVQLPVATEGV